MSQSYSSKRTGTPDPTDGHQLTTVPSQADSTALLPVGVEASNNLGTKPSAHRSSVSAADSSTDMSSAGFGTGQYELNNDAYILVWGECTSPSGIATCIPIYYDNAGTPAPLFEGNEFTILSGVRRVSAAGNFMSPVQGPFRASGADKVKLYVKAITGTWTFYITSI
jgi:hypothetical protein